MVEDPKSSMDDIATTIESDSRIAADILRLANSPHYVHLGRATNAKAAVTRLGLRHVHNLVQTIALQGFCNVSDPSYQKLLTTVWRRSVARAVAMRALCDIVDPLPSSNSPGLNGDTAYLIGLMADVGGSLLLWVVSERKGGALTAEDIRDTKTALETVRKAHEDLGKAMLTRWQFEPVVTATIGHHHRDTPPVVGAAWWYLFVLGDHVASLLLGEPDPLSDPPNPMVIERCAAEFQIPRLILNRFGAELRNELESILKGIEGAR
ncbi:MAG TPA: HDOD domain-containing protein [Polyangia bacterium]|nr:HDOD domain-containing protein [Polyangia bacterium]